MTHAQMVDLLTELHALERLAVVFQQRAMDPDAAPEWQYAVVAVRDRLRLCEYYRSVEPPERIERAERTLRGRVQPRADVTPQAPLPLERPPWERIH